jgi:hypothetical protein
MTTDKSTIDTRLSDAEETDLILMNQCRIGYQAQIEPSNNGNHKGYPVDSAALRSFYGWLPDRIKKVANQLKKKGYVDRIDDKYIYISEQGIAHYEAMCSKKK